MRRGYGKVSGTSACIVFVGDERYVRVSVIVNGGDVIEMYLTLSQWCELLGRVHMAWMGPPGYEVGR